MVKLELQQWLQCNPLGQLQPSKLCPVKQKAEVSVKVKSRTDIPGR